MSSSYVDYVDSPEVMLSTRFGPAGVVVHRRSLTGDFNALAFALESFTASWPTDVSEKTKMLRKTLQSFATTPGHSHGPAARAVLDDMDFLKRRDCRLDLRVERMLDAGGLRLYHRDRPHAIFGRVICCYNDPVTEWLFPEDTVPHGGRHSGLFSARSGAVIQRFGAGDIWRFAGSYNSSGVDGFTHYAPLARPGQAPRLLLVADRL